jgi:hypothetical protein
MKKDQFVGIRMPSQLVDDMNAIAQEINESLATVIRSSCELFMDIAGEQIAAYKIAKSNKIGDSQRFMFEGHREDCMLFMHKQAISDLVGMGQKAEDEVSNFFRDAIKGNQLFKLAQFWPYKGLNLMMVKIDSIRVWCLVGRWQVTILGAFQ